MKTITTILFLSTSAFATYLPFQLSVGSSLKRVEFARLDNSNATCAPSGTISTLSWIANSASNGTGDCTYAITAGVFAQTPVCSCTGEQAGTLCNISTITSTSIRLVSIVSSTGAGRDVAIHLACYAGR